MNSLNIAVVGATGQIGRALIALLEKSVINFSHIELVAGENKEGESIRFKGKSLAIKKIDEIDWEQCHLVFFVANESTSENFAELVAQKGCMVIDYSGYFALDDSIPLIASGINDSILYDGRYANIIAVTNPIVSQLLKTLKTICDIQTITDLNVTNLLPASFSGKKGVTLLAEQSAKLLNGLPINTQQQAFNLLIDTKINDDILVNQIRRVLGNDQFTISFESIHVPVFYGLTQVVTLSAFAPYSTFLQELQSEEVVINDDVTPVTLISQESIAKKIEISHLRSNDEKIQYVSVCDNINFLGAQQLLTVAEQLIKSYYFV